jgi:hypothetical protein
MLTILPSSINRMNSSKRQVCLTDIGSDDDMERSIYVKVNFKVDMVGMIDIIDIEGFVFHVVKSFVTIDGVDYGVSFSCLGPCRRDAISARFAITSRKRKITDDVTAFIRSNPLMLLDIKPGVTIFFDGGHKRSLSFVE